jgi:signal transduction histidine kinase
MGGGTEREQEVLEALAALTRLEAERERQLNLLDRHAVLRALVDRICEEFGFDVSLVGLVEDQNLVLRMWSGTRERSLHDLAVPLGLGLGGRVVAAGNPVTVRDYCRSDRITHDFDHQVSSEGLDSMVGVPIGSGAVRGVLYGATRGVAEIGDTAVDGLHRLAQLATMAVDVADGAVTLAETAVAEERRRLAASLHDTVGAMLFGIGSSLRQLRTAAQAAPVVSDQLELIERQLAQAGTALRESISRLREAPTDRDPVQLAADIAESVRGFERRTGVRASFVPVGPAPALGPERAALLVRAVDEALLNVEKHAGARSVVVTLAVHGDRATVAVMDDGVGFATATDEAVPSTGTGAGLPALQSHVTRAGGSLQLVANDDGGATLRCEMPFATRVDDRPRELGD